MCNARVSVARRLISLARLVVFYLVSAVWIPVIIAVALLRPGSTYYPLARGWARFTLRWFRVRVCTSGAENLQPGRDYVVLANHRSHFDPLALMVAFDHCETRWVAKRELEKVPLFGYGLRVTGQILIDRSDHQSAVDELKRNLGRRGASVVFFPEGHRAESRELLRFKKGGAAFAIDAGLSVLPVAISGSENVLPVRSLIVRPGDIHILIGRPFDAGLAASADREAVTERARDAIAAALACVEHAPGAPAPMAMAAQPTTHV